MGFSLGKTVMWKDKRKVVVQEMLLLPCACSTKTRGAVNLTRINSWIASDSKVPVAQLLR